MAPLAFNRPTKEVFVLLGTGRPEETLAHGAVAHGGKVMRAVEVGRNSPANGVGDGVGIEIMKAESIPSAGRFVVLIDGVVESAGRANNGECSIAECLKLGESAGFVSAWDEKEVASRHDEMGADVIVADV